MGLVPTAFELEVQRAGPFATRLLPWWVIQ